MAANTPADQLEALRRYRATVLDQDNRPLANGEARLGTDSCDGKFWPDFGEEIRNSETARTLRMSDGQLYHIGAFQKCLFEQLARLPDAIALPLSLSIGFIELHFDAIID